MRALRAFGRFWYEFVIGDDPKIAVGVVLALAALCLLMLGTSLGDTALTLIGAGLIVLAFTLGLIIDLRRS